MAHSILTDSAFLKLLNSYPSPHNGQPIRLKRMATDTFELYFERQRGLQSATISYIFSFVSMGVFVEHLRASAQALGYSLDCSLVLPAEAELRGSGLVRFATGRLYDAADGTPDEELVRAIRFRRTSRKRYHAGVSSALADELVAGAKQGGVELHWLAPAEARQTIWLNQRAVFDDMFDEPVRRELDHWLRYSQAEKQTTRDGLAYDCMELNGRLLRAIVQWPAALRWPGVARLLKAYYLRTMADSSSVAYMLAPFGDEVAAFRAGEAVMRFWLDISRRGLYLHPFGTIVSNQAAHSDFVQLAGIADESRASRYLTFICRAGASAPPVPSARMPYDQHLIME